MMNCEAERTLDRAEVPAVPIKTSSTEETPEVPRLTHAELIEEAKRIVLKVPFRDDGPALGFEFDPLPQKDNFNSDHRGKTILLGDGYMEAGADGSFQDIRKRPLFTNGQKRLAMNVDGDPRTDKELEREMKRREKRQFKVAREQPPSRRRWEYLQEQERMHREEQKKIDREQKEREKQKKAQQREEERQKLQLERDMKKLERDMERERKAEERKKQQEVKKREKDLQRAFAAQVKVAQKELQKELAAGPPDDLELELERLKKEDRESQSIPERPLFPTPSLKLDTAFPQLGNKIGGDVVMIWGFVQSFNDIVALPPFSINEFISALHEGQQSPLLSSIHIVLIRLIQADMEESHHIVLTQGSGGTSNFMDRAVVGIAGSLDEAVSWGFDVDSWRAHLNQYTWPEILRQIAIAAGYGAKRSRGLRDRHQRLAEDGEDSAVDETRAGYGLKMPSRLTQGTVKAAAWQVLSEVGPEGLTISEIASRIQRHGLRDLRTSKTPEATVAGALSRDAVFCRVAPATYALHAVLPSAENPSSGVDISEPAVNPDDEDVQDEMDIDRCVYGEAWIPILSNNDYDTLSLEQRLEVLKTLCDMALESPTIRACLDSRLEREIAEQKRLDVEAKTEKRARREQAAEETQRRLMELENSALTESNENLDARVRNIMTESLQTAIPGPATSRGETACALDHIRFEPLGRDRRYNRYWSFCRGDTAEERKKHPGPLFAEVNGQFKVLQSKAQLDELISSLEVRGAREGPLYFALTNYRESVEEETWPTWTEMADVDSEKMIDDEDLWTLESVSVIATQLIPAALFKPSKQTDWLKHLKAQLADIHSAIPTETADAFDRDWWRGQLEQAETVENVVLLMGCLEYALSSEILHGSYVRTPQILYGAWSDAYDPETVSQPDGCLSWLPKTFAAAFLHLFALDASLCYQPGLPTGRDSLLSYKYVQKPFVRELNGHVDVTSVTRTSDVLTSQTVSVEPVRTGGKLTTSSFPVLQKGTPVQKLPVPFSFQVEKMREAVEAAERSGTLYASIQLSKPRGRPVGKQNGRKSAMSSMTPPKPLSELEDEMSTSVGVVSTDDPDVHDDYFDDETIDRSEEINDDDEDYQRL